MHIIVVGFGPLGQLVAQRLRAAGETVVHIEPLATLASRNNVEQIYLAAPTAGTYTARVTHKGTLSGGQAQPFALMVSGNTAHPATIDSRNFGCTFRRVTMGHIYQDLDAVHLEYCFTERQDFDQAVFGLLQLLRQAQREFPDEPRYLHLAIEGHRFPNGDIDLDAHELQSKFLTEFLIDYFTRAILPLCVVNNPRPQKNGIPALSIFKRDNPGH